jgi:hypothetical protein
MGTPPMLVPTGKLTLPVLSMLMVLSPMLMLSLAFR